MLRPFLLIGVGGSGGKTLRGVRHQLGLKLQQLGWHGAIPDAWQFLHFDTPTAQDGVDYALPFLPHSEYHGLVTAGATYSTLHKTVTGQHSARADLRGDIARQLPDPREVKVDVTRGAGQYRAVGRAVALAATKDIATAARQAVAKMSDASALGQLTAVGRLMNTRDDGAMGAPTVIVISSIAGGSGAGQFLDVIEIVKSQVKQQPWSNQFFSILYAPDVFDQVKGNAGMPGNALAAIAETMNGFWTTSPSESTLELLRTQGVAPAHGSAMDRVGAAYPFIVGRSNSKVTFEDQGAVYDAVATSLTAWITDERVQDDMIAYSSGNWQARVGANVLPDTTGLMQPVRQAPPFSSIGFGRVTLGRERFLQYAAERFARSALDIMLSAHAEEDPRFEQMTEREHIAQRAEDEYHGFLRQLGLNEETEQNNDVIDALRAQEGLALLADQLARETYDALADPAQLDKNGGLDVTTWTDRLVTQFENRAPALLKRDESARQDLLDAWIERMPEHILSTVAASVARNGLPTVVEMLKHLDRSLKSASDGLRFEAEQHEEWRASLRSLVADALREAPNSASIRADLPVVEAALDRLRQALEWASEARLRASAAELLAELRAGFLAPLERYLDGSTRALQSRVASQKTLDSRENEFAFWPTRTDDTVPRKYRPAPNERLLIAEGEYPAEFRRLVIASAGTAIDKFDDAMLAVIRTLLVGGEAGLTPLVRNPRSWRPSVKAIADVTGAAQTPHFEVDDDPEVYLARARKWMEQEGTPFAAYIGEDLLSFFDRDTLAPDVYAQRRDRYQQQLQSALGASEPLVKLNPGLLRAVHDKAIGEGTSLVVSSIPFRSGTEMYEVTKSVLGGLGFWDDTQSEGWFRDQKVDAIEVFAMSGFPYQPIVMDSVMEPITRGWFEQSSSRPSRAAFWQFKRSRLLGEAIPADPEVIDAMLRGWYVAKTLNRLAADTQFGERGPRLSVWSESERGLVDFPHPLLHPGVAQPHDYPGAVMQSLAIALVQCNSDSALDPLRPYQVLAALGGERGTLAAESALARWLQHGRVDGGAPAPSPERAGAADAGLDERQLAVRAYLQRELDNFRSGIATQDGSVSSYDYPVTWELRDRIADALGDLISSVMATRSEDTGV